MAVTLRDLLAGIENASEVERVIKENLRHENCKLFVDDGVENIYIPKSRLDSKIAELHAANATIENLNEQLNNAGGVDEKSAQTIKDLKAQIKAHEGEMKALQINNALDILARDKKAKDMEVLKALIDMSKVSVDTNGQVLGLSEQVDALVENKAYLFDVDNGGQYPQFFGGTGAPGKPNNENIFGSKTTQAGDFGKMLAKQNAPQNNNNGVDSDYFFK